MNAVAPAPEPERSLRRALAAEARALVSLTEAREDATEQMLRGPLADAVPSGLVLAPAGLARALGEAAAALRFMLLVHGLGGVAIGILLCFDDPEGPSFRVLSSVPGWPWTWGLTLACAGTATAVGRLTGWIRLARTGATVQASWYLAQFVGFAAAATVNPDVNRYPAVVYIVFAAIMTSHVRWLAAHGGWRE